jgi:hypothetical protein
MDGLEYQEWYEDEMTKKQRLKESHGEREKKIALC